MQRAYGADCWRKQARDERVAAEAVTWLAAKRQLLAIAAACEHLAVDAERAGCRKRTVRAPRSRIQL
jgi:hypothetical protein